MEKPNLTAGPRGLGQLPFPDFMLLQEKGDRPLRPAPPLDRERARAACAPMGSLTSVVVTLDAKKRRRTWYIIEPDPALARQYAAQGLELVEGCKVLIDAEAMRPVALIDLDPALDAADKETPAPCGFNPYWDLPPV